MPDPVASVAARPGGVQFAEAIAFLKGKLPEGSLAWDDLAGPVHSSVFTVAGSITADLARDMQTALVSALENGTTLTEFRKQFDQVVTKHGWTYTGQRGWRTALIFNTNMRTSHMAGRWAQLVANKGQRPFLQYRTADDARVRVQHRPWDGLIRPVDDAFWATHYPPNGWGCRCTVRAYSDAEMKRKGLAVSDAPEVQMRNVVDVDGHVTDQVPVGIDPGWDHNVGTSWIAPEIALGRKLATLPQEVRGPVIDKTISPEFQEVISRRWAAWRNFDHKDVDKRKQRASTQIVGFLDSQLTSVLDAAIPGGLKSTTIAVPSEKTRHLTGAHKLKSQQPWPDEWIDTLPMQLRSYDAAFLDLLPGKSGQTDPVLILIWAKGWNDRLPKITLRWNYQTKVGQVVSVVSLGAVDVTDLNERFTQEGVIKRRYGLLLGHIKGLTSK